MDIDEQIIESAKSLLKIYLKYKYQFKNVDFWVNGEFNQWDAKIAELRKIIKTYREENG